MSNTDSPVQQNAGTTTLGASTITLTTLASAALAACGGGGDSTPAAAGNQTGTVDPSGLLDTSGTNRKDIWRFLDQATMGASTADINYVDRNGYVAWLNQQFSLPKTDFMAAYMLMWNTALANTRKAHPEYSAEMVQEKTDIWVEFVRSTWWKSAIQGKDQLRQRVAFALSEIVVTSLANQTLGERPITMAAWADLLHKHAFGNYRSFLYDVVRSPAMGIYLSHIQNIQPNAEGQRPDQNFARELIQLFTVGLVELDDYGRVQMENGVAKPASTTAATDVKTLSHVFVGLAYDGTTFGTPPLGGIPYTSYIQPPNFDLEKAGEAWFKPMKIYQDKACTQKMVTDSLGLAEGAQLKLLGKNFSIVANDLDATIRAALDILFQHPNLAPFIAKQMIQRLVTSNPSSGQIFRAAQAFRRSNYEMKALIQAILMDEDASTAPAASATDYGKIREPILRVTHLLRAFKNKPAYLDPVHGVFDSTYQADTSLPFDAGRPAHGLGQGPLMAVNVFNFFSPTYVANGGATAANKLVAPELQIITETTVASYVNAIQDILENGMFSTPALVLDLTDEAAVAGTGVTATPTASGSLVTQINTKLMGGNMSSGLQTYIATVLNEATALSGTQRARLAILLAMVSPEYIVQK
jgi:uncharacterized protein (DUF1800 family)